MDKKYIAVPGRLESVATDGQIAGASQVYDDGRQKSQAAINDEFESEQAYLDNKVSALQKQDVVPVDTLPAVADADPKKIYRVVGTDSYTDHMLNAAGDDFKILATYSFPGIDDEPTSGSGNLIKSGGVADIVGEVNMSISKDSVYELNFKYGKTYIIAVTGASGTPVLSTRATSGGSTIDTIGSISVGEKTEFTPTASANYLRCGTGGGNTTIKIYVKDEIKHELYRLDDKIDSNVATLNQNIGGLGQSIDNLEQDVEELQGEYKETMVFDKVLTESYISGYSIDTSVAVGSAVDVTPTQNNSFCYIIVPCKQGDVFLVSGRGGVAPKVYCFTDSEYNKISGSSANIVTNMLLTAPSDGYLIANSLIVSDHCLAVIYKDNPGNTIEEKVEAAYGKVSSMDDTPTAGSESLVKSGGVFGAFNELYINEIQLSNNVDGKYIASSGNLASASGYKVYYIPCQKGDKFYLSYANNGPSSSAARGFGIYSTADINSVGSSTKISLGFVLTHIVADEEVEIEITDVNSKLLLVQQMVSGLINLVPKLKNKEYRSKFERIDETLTGHTLQGLVFDDQERISGYITSNGNLGAGGAAYYCYKFNCSRGDKFSLFTFAGLDSTIARSYAVYSSDSDFNSTTRVAVGPVSSIGRLDIDITQDNAKCILIGWRTIANLQLLKQVETTLVNKINEDIYNLRLDSNKIHFTYGYELKETNINEVFDLATNTVHSEYYNLNGLNSIMFQIQDKMDELAEGNPGYITKFDAAELVGLSYPVYANGVESEGDYLITPAYKTYGYKLSYVSAGVNGFCNRPTKILITGGIHGNEECGSLNLYTIMKELCDDYLSDINLFKIRGAFEIYIVPCVNGYSSIHRNRKNANGVNINRNYPVNDWENQGSDNPEDGNYRGPSAGSEFETQLVMALINEIKPDMYIDAHNYATSDPLQFYTEMTDEHNVRLAYDSIADVSFTLKKTYPAWFGNNYAMLKGDATHPYSGHAPADHDNSSGKGAVWAFANGVPFAITLEISGGINYTGGVLGGHDIRSEEVFQIGEYTFMNQLMRYGEYVSNNIVSTRYTDWRIW